MRKRVLSALVIAVLTVALMSGFAVAKDLEFSILVCNMSHSFFVDLIKGAEDAGAKLGVKIVTYDAQDDPAQQFRQVEDAIILGVDALILNPTDVDAMVPAVRQALNEGIPVFTVDRDVRQVGQIAYIGTNNVEAAADGAEKMLELLEAAGKPKPWKVVILGNPVPPLPETVRLLSVIDPGRKGEVKWFTYDRSFRQVRGLNVMQDILATADQVDAVIAANDEMV